MLLGLAPPILPLSAGTGEEPVAIASPEAYNLVLINIDALRADHLGCYGYQRSTSPFIDSLAAEGILFERALSNSSYTRESVAALLSGRLPSCSGSIGWRAAPAPDGPNLGSIYQDAGYRTGFFSNTVVLKHPSFARGFDEVQHLPDRWNVSGAGPELSQRALEFVRKASDRRFFAYLHYLDPHGPYEPGGRFYERFTTHRFPNPLSIYGNVRPNLLKLMEEGFGPGDARFEDLVVRYDAEIASTDYAIEMLFQGLRELGLLDRTLVLITADHGEEFLDHGYVEHAWTLYEESVRIPLIFWAPDLLKPQRVQSTVSTVDVLPTVLELMKLPYRQEDVDGSPLFEHRGSSYYHCAPPAKPQFAELLIQERNMLRAVTYNSWKYIAAQKWLAPAERHHDRDGPTHDVWAPAVHEELYNLADDPLERRNVAAKEGSKLQELRGLFEAYQTRCGDHNAKESGVGAVVPSESDVERLRALGY